MKNFIKEYRLIILIWFIMIGLLYFPVWSGKYILSPTNFMYTVKPWDVYGIEATGPSLTDPIDSHFPEIFRKFYQGDYSFWNNYNAFGYPESFNYFLNPVNWVYLLPLKYAILLNSILKYSIAYFGMCVFIKRLGKGNVAAIVGGVSYGLSSSLVMWHYWAHTDVMMMLPVLFAVGYRLMMERRKSDIFKLSLVVYMMCVAGMPAFAAYSFYMFVPYIVIYTIIEYKNFKDVILVGLHFVAAFVIGVIASASYVYYVYRMAVKSGYLEIRGGLSGVTLALNNLKSFAVPYYRETGYELNIFESCGYVGIVVLVLLTFAVFRYKYKRQTFWIVTLIVCVLLTYTHLLDKVYAHIPAISTSLKIRVINLIPFLGSLIAATQLDDIFENREYYRNLKIRWIVYALLTIALTVAMYYIPKGKELFSLFVFGAPTVIAIELFLSACAKNSEKDEEDGQNTDNKPSGKRTVDYAAYIIIILAVLLNMTYFAGRRNPLAKAPAEVIPEPTESISYMQENGRFRIYTYSGWTMFPNSNVYYGLKSIEAHSLINTNEDIKSYMKLIDDKMYPSATDSRGSGVDNYPLLQYAGVDIIAGSKKAENIETSGYYKALEASDGITVYQTEHFADRFYLAKDVQWLDTQEHILQKMSEEYADGVVFTDEKELADILPLGENAIADANESDNIKIISDKRDDILLSVKADADRLLVFNEYNNGGWEVYVDGAKAENHKVNYLFNAVLLTAGEHTVEYRFNSQGQVLFLIVTAVSVALIVIISIILSAFELKKTKSATHQEEK